MATSPPSRSAHRGHAVDKLGTALTVGMHLACLAVFLVPFSRTVLLLATGSYLVRMWGITAGYHRYFAHRTYKTSRVFRFVLAWIGTASMQNGPLWWASWHRNHHRYSDTPLDAHSPAHGGFWHAHLTWFLDGSHEAPDLSNVQDLSRVPELRFLEKYKWIPMIAHGVMCFAIAGVAGLAWGFVLSTIVLLHATMCINSLAHVWGSRRFETPDGSRNNALLALVTLGEGWHNNHHHRMTSTRQGVAWWELDLTFGVLRVLSWLGIVWDLQTHATVDARRRARMAASPTSGTEDAVAAEE